MDKTALEEGSELSIDFEKRGSMVPAIVQHAGDGRVLMLAYVNKAALDKTLECGMATFWSTSRGELWTKGETSGDYLAITEILVDCDQDALVYRVEPKGAGACHTRDPQTGRARSSCFYRNIDLANGTLRNVSG
jgi:phosphoribosyl-AMP cyclohydrolase